MFRRARANRIRHLYINGRDEDVHTCARIMVFLFFCFSYHVFVIDSCIDRTAPWLNTQAHQRDNQIIKLIIIIKLLLAGSGRIASLILSVQLLLCDNNDETNRRQYRLFHDLADVIVVCLAAHSYYYNYHYYLFTTTITTSNCHGYLILSSTVLSDSVYHRNIITIILYI